MIYRVFNCRSAPYRWPNTIERTHATRLQLLSPPVGLTWYVSHGGSGRITGELKNRA